MIYRKIFLETGPRSNRSESKPNRILEIPDWKRFIYSDVDTAIYGVVLPVTPDNEYVQNLRSRSVAVRRRGRDPIRTGLT